MRKVTLICDACHKEVKWLYDMPRMMVEGLTINFYPSRTQACETCARAAISYYRKRLGKESER